MKGQLVTMLVITWACLIAMIGVIFLGLMDIHDLKDKVSNHSIEIAELTEQLKAKTPALIKFYTIPGYACDTSNIPGHCTNMWSITQAEYDKDFFKEVKQ